MSVRFKVTINGNQTAVVGIPGAGVLGVTIHRVQREDEPEDIEIHVSGLGHYHPGVAEKCHVHWDLPTQLAVGDEVNIRVLPHGEYDEPANVRLSKKIKDPDFGAIQFNISAWDGKVPFKFAPSGTKTIQFHLNGSEDGPSQDQRELFQQLRARYAALWPSIAESLCKCHLEHKAKSKLRVLLNPLVYLTMGKEPGSELELGYSFRSDPDHCSYFVVIRDWEVVSCARVE
jgi:hypothetical protein